MTASGARAAEPTAAAKAEARASFEKGLAASHDDRFADALAAFERAYALAPDHRVLYNVAQVRVVLGRFAEAADAYEAYLAAAGPDVGEDRRREVSAALAAALAHVATLDVRVSEEGADVRVDGRLVGTAPLAAPVRVTEGRHTVEALAPNRPAQVREVEVVGGAATTIAFEIPPPLELEIKAPAPRFQTPNLVTAHAPPPAHRWRPLGYGLAGAGLVTTAVGAVLAYTSARDASGARARLEQAANPAAPDTPDVLAYDAALIDFNDDRARNRLGWALVGVGAAAVAGGAAIVVVGSASTPMSVALGGTW
ncbi:MAG TPA: hypothetical protein VHJ20_24595 [Polyangia bacterium]|nr:hypothetical protein [Polyangia bacterium]